MKIKQKIGTTLAILGLVAGMSVLFLTVLPTATVSAQVTENCLGLEGQALEDCMKESAPEESEEEEPDCAPGSEGCCGGVKTSIIGGDLCGDSKSADENGTIYKLLIGALNVLTAGVGIAAVGGVAYGALLYTTAENKPDQTKKAIGIITNVAIGIVAYGLMYVLLNYLIPGGILK